eukprot:GFKZ01006979.1.p1 GENE.GFKZ01006979.1~~GFKZ01006979.1.p1  ORF type:complete len:609 (-),score=81.87 GFKZ01006979.1:100-1770(-)
MPESVSNLIQSGNTYAKHAITNDKAACSTNDPSFYRLAKSSYERAIGSYTQAHDRIQDPEKKQFLVQQISDYRRRYNLMDEWLASFDLRKRRQDEMNSRRANIPAKTVSNLPLADDDFLDFPPQNSDPVPRPPYLEPHPNPTPRHPTRNNYNLPSDKHSATRENSNPKTADANSTAPSAPPLSAVLPHHRLTAQDTGTAPPRPAKPSPHCSNSTAESNNLQPALSTNSSPSPSHRPSVEMNDVSPLLKPNVVHQVHMEQSVPVRKARLMRERTPQKRWDEIAGLLFAKDILQEAVGYRELRHLLGSERPPWRTILLYGPAGVGKRVLAEAAAKEGGRRFVEIWGGDLKDGLALATEAVKGMGEVLVYVDEAERMANGLREYEAMDDVLWVFASRVPWELDEAFLRRVERRVHLGLPGHEARTQLLETLLRNVSHDITFQEMECIARECEGLSGADLEMLVRDAALEPVRTVREATWFRPVKVKVGMVEKTLQAPCGRTDESARELRLGQIKVENVHVPAVNCLDFDLAMVSTKPSVTVETVERHLEFTRATGIEGS